jgi:hypothetical protein
MNEVQFLTYDQLHADQEISHVVFQEILLIPPCKPVWNYVGCSQ